MRFSDLKKKLQPGLPEEAAPPRAVEPPPARKPPEAKAPDAPLVDRPLERAAGRAVERAASTRAAAVDAQKTAEQRKSAREVYGRGVNLLREIFSNEGSQNEGAFAAVGRLAGELVDLTTAGNQQLVILAMCATPDDPVCAHSLNVAISALKLGAGLKLARPQLLRLGTAALLHDLGRPKSYRLGLEKGLAPSEAARVKEWLRGSEEHFALFGDAPPEELKALAGSVSQLHGGPSSETAAQIISLCDLYDAMTHGYDGAVGVPAREAFKTLVGLKDNFDHALVKQLLEELSPFPPGSLVKLADGRVGCVVAVNKKMLTRPIIEIWLQSDGKAQEPPTIIDLAAELLIGVAGAPDEAKMLASPAAPRVQGLRLWSEDPAA